jgi:hypothetical protein
MYHVAPNQIGSVKTSLRNADHDGAIKPGAGYLKERLTIGEERHELLVKGESHRLLVECGFYAKKIGGK